ncbi:MAG: ankyrin repeat domain-containing protein [Pseudomonadota bacterium]|jgi:hypothetical protein
MRSSLLNWLGAGLCRGAAALLCAVALAGGAAAQGALPDPTRFAVAMELGDMASARRWLDAGLDPDFMGSRIGTGLMIAAWEGNIPLMELFLSRGAQIDKTNRFGEQAIMHAAWKGHAQAVQWLLDHGARFDREGKEWSALHYAVFAGHEQVARLLIERGADVNARSINGSTPLMMAAREGRESIARLLLERGADAGVVNDNGEDALVWAMRHKHVSIAKMVSTPEQFGAAVRKPPEAFGPAVRSAPAPDRIGQLLQDIRFAEFAGKPAGELRKAFWEAVAQLNREVPPSVIADKARPSALVIRAKRGVRGQESAELIYAPERDTAPAKPAARWQCRIANGEERCVLR